jgi:hypothetical protein
VAHPINATGRNTMPYTLSKAAKATATNKTTIMRAIKSGKITGMKDDHGNWQIEPAELHRVYPPAKLRTNADVDAAHRYAPAMTQALDAQIAALRDTAELLRAQLADIRQDRDHWREQAQAITRQLPDASGGDARPWWKRLAG